jgi:hypothetical protein
MEEEQVVRANQPILGRIWGIFTSPKATFESIAQSIGTLDLIVPVLILIALSIGSQAVVTPIVVQEQQQRVLQREDIPDEQKDIILERIQGAIGNPVRYLIGGAAAIIWYALISGIVMFFGAFILGGQASYRDTFAVVLYSQLVGIVEAALKIPLTVQLATTNLKTGLIILLPGSLEGTLIYRFFQRLDFFAMWKIFLVALGVAAIYKVEAKRTRMLLFGAWVIAMFLLAWLLDGRRPF